MQKNDFGLKAQCQQSRKVKRRHAIQGQIRSEQDSFDSCEHDPAS